MLESSWTENPEVKKMDKRKVEVLRKLMLDTDGKSLSEGMRGFMAANNTLRSQGLSFSRDEAKVVIDLLTEKMTAQEKAQAQMVMNFMNNMRK